MNKILKASIAVIFCVSVLLLFAVTVSAATSGTSGDTKWILSSGTLTIAPSTSGSDAAMDDYTAASAAPWYSNRSSITSVVISDGVTNISQYGFYNYTALTSITIGGDVEKIGAYAFAKCTALNTVDIPEGIEKIGYAAFNACTNLRTLYYNAKKAETTNGADSYLVFGSCSNLKNIYIGENVQCIPDYIFAVTYITSIDLPDSVRRIGESSFQNCTSLTKVTMGYKLYQIGDKAFKGCTKLATFELPELVTSIGEEAFAKCTALTSMTVSYHVTQIGADAFTDSGITVYTTTDAYAALFCETYGISYVATTASYGDIGSSTETVEVKVNTNTSLSVLNGKLVIGVDFDTTLTSECVHIAFYSSEDKVVDYMIIPIVKSRDDIYIVANDVSSASYAKIFVWDSLETLRPISPIEKVEITRP